MPLGCFPAASGKAASHPKIAACHRAVGQDDDGSGRQRGSGSILAVAVIGALAALFSLLLPLAIVLSAKQKVWSSADAAALAAADVAVGIAPGAPCVAAASVAGANGVEVTVCRVDGSTATVRTTVVILGFLVRGQATAGQISEAKEAENR